MGSEMCIRDSLNKREPLTSRDLEVDDFLSVPARFWNPVFAIFVRLDWWLIIERLNFVDIAQRDVRIDRVFPLNLSARVGCQSAKNRSHRALGSVLALGRHDPVSEIGKQVVVFLLMPSARSFCLEKQLAIGSKDLPTSNIGVPLCAMDMLTDAVETFRHMSTLVLSLIHI